MNKLLSFVKQFTSENILEINKIQKIGRRYFYLPSQVETEIKKITLEPYAAGLFMGELIDGKFRPEFPLLDILVKYKPHQVVCGKKGETLFLYCNNLIEESMISRNADTGFVLVLNQQNELLGFGELKTDKYGKKIVTNNLNRSNFLKRETPKSSKLKKGR